MSKVSKMLSRMALLFSAVGLVLMTLIIGWQVFARYVLNTAPSWTEQAALLLMLWFILFASAAGVREGFHIRISILEQALKARHKRWLIIFTHLIVLIFGALMAWNGGKLVLATWHHIIPAINIPRGLAYAPIAVAGALISFFSIEHIWLEAKGKTVELLWN